MTVKKQVESGMKKYIWVTVAVALLIGGTSWFITKLSIAKAKLAEVTL